MKSIALVTSGGDCPGMNAAVVAATRAAQAAGIRVWGSRFGFDGMMDDNLVPLDYDEIRPQAQRGGSFLQTARSKRFAEPTGVRAALSVLKTRDIDGVVVLGGDGSLHGAQELHEQGVPVVVIPATIDNNVSGTDYSIGFDTACNQTVRVVNEIMDTATALEGRIFLVETLGLPTGFIAYASAIAVGADFCLIPEVPYDLNQVCESLRARVKSGRGYAIGIMSEAVGSAVELAREIEARTGERVRPTVLGHAQRGGSPTFFDRALAEGMGSAAVDALLSGQRGKMAALAGSEIRLIEMEFPLGHQRTLAEIPLRKRL